MSVLNWSGGIRIEFDKPIVSDPDVAVVVDIENNGRTMGTAIGSTTVSGSYDNAFDENLGTFWRGATTGWIGRDFGVPVILTQFDVYSGGSFRPRAYTIDGSTDGETWVTLASGELPNATGWTTITFANTTGYRYWRYNSVSCWSSRLYIYEMFFTGTYITYVTDGWTVTGYEYDMQPEGELVEVNYPVKRVTKSEDNLSVFLWIDMGTRMKNPIGDITVSYDGVIGNLEGAASAFVESFVIDFTPTNITPFFDPQAIEHLTAEASMTVSTMEVVYQDRKLDEHITAEAQMVIVVTHVGALPL